MLISRTTTSDGTLYYLYNGHGGVVQLTDSNGTVVMTYDYDAFGVVTEATGTITNNYIQKLLKMSIHPIYCPTIISCHLTHPIIF